MRTLNKSKGQIRAGRRFATLILIVGVVGFAITVVPAQVASAATLTVTNCNDSGPGSLRQAVLNATAGNTITFALSPSCSTISLTSGEIDISQTLTIAGPGENSLAVSGSEESPVLAISGGTVVISGLTIEDGNQPSAINGDGGGVYNDGALTISNCDVLNNYARGWGSGIYNDSDGDLNVTNSVLSFNGGQITNGGAIANEGTVVVTNSELLDNTADYASGLLNLGGGTATITDSTVSGGTSGGLSNQGDMTVIDSTVSNNANGGIGNGGTLNVTSSAVLNNISGGIRSNSGAVTVADSTIAGNSITGGDDPFGGGILSQAGSFTVTGSTVADNQVTGPGSGGGGIAGAVTLSGTIVADNQGGDCNGTFTDGGYNLDDDGTCGFTANTDRSDTPAGLDPTGAEDNGGPTPTVALEPGSAAIGAVHSASLCSTPDQRGVTRGNPCDIGAYQSHFVTVTNCNDSGSGSLRQAAQTAVFGEAISFALAPACSVITLASTIDLNGTVAIDGPGANALAVNGNNAVEPFDVSSGATTTISGLTVNHGNGVTNDGGGGILNLGTLTLTDATVSNNAATDVGGGISNLGTLTLVDCILSDNTSGASLGVSGLNGGGGIFNDGTLTVTDSTLSGNSTAVDADPSDGGAIENDGGEIDVSGSTLSGNHASGDVSGPGATGEGGGLWSDDGAIVLDDATVSNNGATESGGGIDDEGGGLGILSASTVSDNSVTGTGGGIDNGASLWLIANSTLSGNSATGNGGGIDNSGELGVTTSTESGNKTSSGNGGGIDNSGELAVSTSTVSGNSAVSGGGGGVGNLGELSMTMSTLADNMASTGGGVDNATGATASAAGIIVADSAPGIDCHGPMTDAGYNLDDDGSCGFSAANHSQSRVNPELGPLEQNGGPTETQVPAYNSPVFGQIPEGTEVNDTTLCPGTDQRGVYRPQGSACDIGAVEPPIASQTITFTSTPPSDPIARGPSYTVSATGGGSGNPVTFSTQGSGSTACSVTGSTVTFNSPGVCDIYASQAGNASYYPAGGGTQAFFVEAGSQAITSANSSTAIVGSPFSFTVTTTGEPIPSITVKGKLPKHVTLTGNGGGSAFIAGTPTKEGVYPFTIRAAYGKGKKKTTVTQAFTLTVDPK